MPAGRPKKVKSVPVDTVPKTFEEATRDFLKEVITVEEQMENLRGHLKDVKSSYEENGWLEKDQQQLILKAYKLFEKEVDFDDLEVIYKKISQMILSGFSKEGGEQDE